MIYSIRLKKCYLYRESFLKKRKKTLLIIYCIEQDQLVKDTSIENFPQKTINFQSVNVSFMQDYFMTIDKWTQNNFYS